MKIVPEEVKAPKGLPRRTSKGGEFDVMDAAKEEEEPKK